MKQAQQKYPQVAVKDIVGKPNPPEASTDVLSLALCPMRQTVLLTMTDEGDDMVPFEGSSQPYVIRCKAPKRDSSTKAAFDDPKEGDDKPLF